MTKVQIGKIIPNMSEQPHKLLEKAVATLIRPLARVLLRNGIAFSTFAEICKKVFVEVAHQEFAEPGKQPTVTRVSAMTGLTRKETKRLLEIKDIHAIGTGHRYNRAIRVISGWMNDPEFLNAEHQPACLPVEERNGSFSALVKKYSGDMTTTAMLRLLEGAGNVEVKNQRACLLKHAYIPSNDASDKIRILGTDTFELMSCIDHNLTATPDDLYFQRKVSNHQVPTKAVPQFRALVNTRGQALLEEFDHWLSEQEKIAAHNSQQDAHCYVSLGIFYFQNLNHDKEITDGN